MCESKPVIVPAAMVSKIDFVLDRDERRLRLRGAGVQSQATVVGVRLSPTHLAAQNRRP